MTNDAGNALAALNQQLEESQAKKQMLERMMLYVAEQGGELEIDWEDVYYDGDEQVDQDVIQLNELAEAPSKLDDTRNVDKPNVIEVNLGLGGDHKPTYVNLALEAGDMTLIMKLLKQYRDCFAWDYSEMPGLDRSLVEHKIPLKVGYRPHKQPPRRFSEAIVAKIKEEVLRL